MPPRRRLNDNNTQRILRFWPLVLFAVAVVAAGAQLQYAVADNEKDLTEQKITHATDIIRIGQRSDERQQALETSLREQAEVNGRIDTRTINIEKQLDRIILRLERD